jgi:hypothetical protein
MPWRSGFITQMPLEEKLEHLRQGTREQYESEWQLIRYDTTLSAGQSHAFTHELDDIPTVVDVIRSETNDGKSAGSVTIDNSGSPAAGTVAVAKTNTTITITSNHGAATNGVTDFYFKVRAF